MATNPFDQFDTAPQQGTVYGAPPKPPEPPTGYTTDPNAPPLHIIPGGPADPNRPGAKVTYSPLPPDQVKARGLDPSKSYQISSEGEVKDLPGVADKGAETQSALESADQLINAVHRARNFVNDSPYSTGVGYSVTHWLPATDAAKLDAVINQELRGNIFLEKIAKMRADNNSPQGGTGIGRIMQAEIPLITGSLGSLDPAKMGRQETLNSLLQIERSALRSKAILNGENPDDPAVAQKYGIPALPDYPKGGLPGASPPQNNGGGTPPGMAGGSPPQPPSGGAPTDQLTAATGQTKEVLDPNLTPVRREYMARLAAGQSGAQLVSFLRQAGVSDPTLLQAAVQQAQFRQKNPQVPISAYNTSAIDHITQQMGAINRAVNAVGQSAPGAAMIAAGNQALAGYGPEVVSLFGANPEQARLNAQYSGQDHPDAALLGSIAGGTAAALGGEGALGGLGMDAGVGRSLLADTGYGALAGSGASPNDRTSGALTGALAGAAGSIGGQALTRGVGGVVRGVVNPAVQKLVGSDVPLTIGQAVGGTVKNLEDKATSIPILGDMIQARRAEGVRQFNSRVFDKALEPIGASVGKDTGQEAVATAQQKVSDAFTKALQGTAVYPDQPFIASARGPMERLASIKRDNLGPEIVSQIEEATKDVFDPQTGALTGENMQTLMDSLRQIRQAYKNDPLYPRVIKPAMQGIENSVVGMFQRQAPQVMPAFNAAKQAYRRVSILSDAVNAADNTDNVFTAAQLRRADLNNAKKYTGAQRAAAGGVQFGDISRPAQQILPSKVPNSGTTDRLALIAAPAAIAGSGAGLGYATGDAKTGSEAGLGLATLLSLLYTKKGQSLLVNAAVKRASAARAAGSALQRLGSIGGALGASAPQTSSSQ